MPCSYGNLPKPHASRRVGFALREKEKMCLTSNQGKSRCKVGKGVTICVETHLLFTLLSDGGPVADRGED